MIERRLQQVHLRLQQVALRLRDEERRRQPDFEAPLLVVLPLLGQRGRGACRLHAFGGASYLPSRLTHAFGSLEAKARDALRRLALLDLRTRVARFFVATSESVISLNE